LENLFGTVQELVVDDGSKRVELFDFVAILPSNSINNIVHVIFCEVRDFWYF